MNDTDNNRHQVWKKWKLKMKTRLTLDNIAFAHRLKILYDYARGESGWATGIVVDHDDADRINAARNTAIAAGNRRLNAKRAREGRG